MGEDAAAKARRDQEIARQKAIQDAKIQKALDDARIARDQQIKMDADRAAQIKRDLIKAAQEQAKRNQGK